MSQIRKGIILAGGSGTRLRPLTDSVCKQLLPVYDKPLIHYPLSTLMILGIREILIISTPKDLPMLESVLGDGSRLGISIEYKDQKEPRGLPEAFLVGEDFINGESVCMILGDNILHWGHLKMLWTECMALTEGAYIVGIHHNDPELFGVIECDENQNVLSLEEKPKVPKSNIVAIGLYFFDRRVVEYTKMLKPSARGELEIVDLSNIYLRQRQLSAKFLSRGVTWFDAGTFDSLLDASNLVNIVEKHQGLKIGCIEEASFNLGYIDEEQLLSNADRYANSAYGLYLRSLV
ncbi:MAG: glucose-1-phosphate thymidylyltransferase RfbA [Alphaproteobacteria bacterium]|nr:glucose-1-phosphate thymidylyltransferase RfbA [Alphaproteobacteria bacterium]